ncbi:MAG TPA: MarR family transcriptional regulator [Polyangia bacterium]|nr:MarR family transcriptional regulator [Polyangia bacterium]
MTTAADRIWNALVTAVMETREDWRRRVTEATGLSFARVRALKRLTGKPLALNELARSMGTDAPAATVIVNALVKRGLAVRTPHPTNGRIKLVSLTPAGRALVTRMKAVTEAAPTAFAGLSARELATLERAVDRLKL